LHSKTERRRPLTDTEDYGTIRIHLDELIQDAGISKNRLSHKAEMQRTQINNYCFNRITRLDVDVLARLCAVLGCQIGDLLEYVPPAPAKAAGPAAQETRTQKQRSAEQG
jgi:putative transcriptional regulator